MSTARSEHPSGDAFGVDRHVLRPREIAGVPIHGDLVMEIASGDQVQMTVLTIPKGYVHPDHRHEHNESIGYLIRGRLEMTIDGRTYQLKSGDIWRHPRGITHSTRALEDTLAIEVHAPPREDYLRPSDR